MGYGAEAPTEAASEAGEPESPTSDSTGSTGGAPQARSLL
jgi:hypothetical protein